MTETRGRKPEARGRLSDLDPDGFRVDPYEPDYLPLPLADELRRAGVFPASEGPVSLQNPSQAVHIQTRVPPTVVFTIDRIVELRITGLKSRQEVFRTALTNYVCSLADQIQQDHMSLAIWRLNQQRRNLAELERLNNVEEMISTTRKVAGKFLALGSHIDAIKALRQAKRFMEDVPLPALRKRVEVGVYGGDGVSMPAHWEEDEIAVLWSKVMEGELDKEDEQGEREQVKIG